MRRSLKFFGSQSVLGNQGNGNEAATREAIYNIAIAEMEAHNAVKSQTYTQGVNRSTDLTLEEFQAFPIRGYIAGAKSGLPKVAVHERLADIVKPGYSRRGHSS